MKIYLVDDNEKFRASLRLFLESHHSYEIVGEATTGDEFLQQKIIDADIVLMDINMPGINGLQATKLGLWNNKKLKFLAVSQFKDDVDLQLLIESGFKGFVSKSNVFDELEKAMQIVNSGGYSFPGDIALPDE
ncbi:MAG: response regulator transcription factor [Bacteroidales bacterium]|nr:response regulator transcription factor [Bacteroidales bacterium]